MHDGYNLMVSDGMRFIHLVQMTVDVNDPFNRVILSTSAQMVLYKVRKPSSQDEE